MKIVNIPTKVFETGDRVLTSEGKGVVILDELELYDPSGWDDPVKAAEQAEMQMGVHVRLLEESCNHQLHDEITPSRSTLILEAK